MNTIRLSQLTLKLNANKFEDLFKQKWHIFTRNDNNNNMNAMTIGSNENSESINRKIGPLE